jgi:APA family basic amino acid/polyamine antiporter
MPPPVPSALGRTLGAVDYFTLAFGTIIGVGWVVVMHSWLKRGGPAGAALAFLVGGLLLVPVGVVYGRLTAHIPRADSEIAYLSGRFPPWTSFAVGWMMAFAYLVVCPFEAVAVAELAAQIWPDLRQVPLYAGGGSTVYLTDLLLGLTLVGVITAINYRGVHHSARVQNLFTFGLLAVFVVFATLGLGRGRLANLQPPFAKDADFWGPLASTLAVLGIVPYFMAGFETIPRCSEERAPHFHERRFVSITLLAIGVGIFFYVTVILVTASLHPWQQLAATDSATTAAFQAAFQWDWLVNLILFGAILSLIKVFNGCFLAATRLFFAMGRGELVARGFGAVHPRFQTPTRAIVFAGLFSGLGCFLGKAVLDPITEVGSFAFAVGWFATCLAYCCGAGGDAWHKGKAVGYVGAAVAFLLAAMKLVPFLPVSFNPWEYVALLAWVVLGLVCWFLRPGRKQAIKENRPEELSGVE